jgi:hypothetical protein
MTTVRLVGQDTIKINERILADFGHGEIGKISFSADLVTVKTGKNGNTIYASNTSGEQATLVIKILRGSADDKQLNTWMVSQKSDLPKWVLMNAELVKNLGDGEGAAISDTYVLTGGVFTKNLETTSNVEGDVEQGIVTYTMQFATAPRSIS